MKIFCIVTFDVKEDTCALPFKDNFPLPSNNSLLHNNNNNGPNGHLFYVGGDLMMRRGMLPIIMLPDGDLRIVLHLVPF